MQIKVTAKPDPTTDLIFIQKLAEYSEKMGINLKVMTTQESVRVLLEGSEEQLQEIKDYLEKAYAEQT